MASGKRWGSVVLALVAAGLMNGSSCSDDDSKSGSGGVGGGVFTPLQWNNQASGPNGTAGAGGSSPLQWVDPNTPVNSGGGGVISSQDERTWYFPDQYLPQADPESPHPLSTHTASGTITNPEDLCASFINAYRQQVLGVGAGGGFLGGGGFPIGGGGFQNVLLPMHLNIRKSVRAHCKHIAIYHAGPLTINSPSTDTFFTGGVAPAGRTAKCKIATQGAAAAVISGPNYPDASSASNWFINNGVLQAGSQQWTHLGVGYWTGFSEQYYWSCMMATNPALVP